MNRSLILYFTGKLMHIEALLLLLPLVVSAIYRESCFFAFLATIGIAFFLGYFIMWIAKPRDKTIYAREGFIMVALSWLIFSLIGALPFVLCREIPSYFDAFFEIVSGFTTTGASILTDVEALSHGTLFWRSFSNWVGGMGILVFIVALLPGISDRSIHILKAEMPGPIMGKLVPRLKDTAKILYLIYLGLTVLELILLLCGGMSFFESLLHSFSTAGTGGFGIKADGLASYSPYIQWVIAIFMLIFGTNFNVYYFILCKRFREAGRVMEAWVFFGLVIVSTTVITANIFSMYDGFGEALRHSVFQIASLVSTTGFSTTDFNMWPSLSKAILLIFMFTGACANSTSGGLKMSRVIILFKSIKAELHKMIHPRSVTSVKYEGKALDSLTLNGVRNYFALYMIMIFTTFIVISFEPKSFETNFSAAVVCFNNIGPGFDGVGPAANFASYSPFSKVVLSFAMLFGRLEIYPLLLTLAPATWKNAKKK